MENLKVEFNIKNLDVFKKLIEILSEYEAELPEKMIEEIKELVE